MNSWVTIEVWGLQNHCMKSEHLNLALVANIFFSDSIFIFLIKCFQVCEQLPIIKNNLFETL